MKDTAEPGLLHVLYWLKNEGSPNLAQTLLAAERRHFGRVGAVARLVPEQDELSAVLKENGFAVHALEWSDKSYFRLVGRVRRLLKEGSFKGVVVYAIGPHVSVAWAGRSLGIPVALHIGNAPPTDKVAKRKIGLQLWAGLPAITAMCACSKFVAAEATREYRLPRRRVRSILNGLEVDAFDELRSRRPYPIRDPWRIAMVGSLGQHKDQTTLLGAFAELRTRGHDVALRLAGSGDAEADLRRTADRLGIQDHVQWGSVPDARTVLDEADVFAYSVTPQEGMGIALAEALAAGLPAVASDVGAGHEVLDSGRLGTLVRTNDPVEWADALEAARGRPPVAKEELRAFDIDRTLEGYLSALGVNP